MNIEVFLEEKLKAKLPVPVYTEHQEKDPDAFVIIDKTGSGESNFLSHSNIAFQSYAESKFKASELNEKVKEAVKSLASLPEIGSVKLESDYPFTDVTTKRHRYQALFTIYHY